MRIKKYITEILISILLLVLLFYSSDPIFYSDTQRYLKGTSYDPPLYFIIISIMQLMFSTLNSLIILQTFLIGLSIIFFTNTISKYFYLNKTIKTIVAISLFLPILEFYLNT